jgi:hypothetical protein
VSGFKPGDWVKITAKVAEVSPNCVDLVVELFSKTDQYLASVRADNCEPTSKPIPPEPAEGSVVLLGGSAWQRVGEWWQQAGLYEETTWEQLNARGDVVVIHDA